jgi:hypothetical protein
VIIFPSLGFKRGKTHLRKMPNLTTKMASKFLCLITDDQIIELLVILQIVADGDAGRVQNQLSSVSKEAQTQPPPVSKESLKTPPVSGMDKKTTRDALEQARAVLQTYDAELEEKRQEAAELQQEREHDGR